MYNACMPNIQVRDVSDSVHAELTRRASRSGKSLQQYLTEQLEIVANTPTLDDILDIIDSRDGGQATIADSLEAIADGRARR